MLGLQINEARAGGASSQTLLLHAKSIRRLVVEVGGRLVFLRPATKEAEAASRARGGLVCLDDRQWAHSA